MVGKIDLISFYTIEFQLGIIFHSSEMNLIECHNTIEFHLMELIYLNSIHNGVQLFHFILFHWLPVDWIESHSEQMNYSWALHFFPCQWISLNLILYNWILFGGIEIHSVPLNSIVVHSIHLKFCANEFHWMESISFCTKGVYLISFYRIEFHLMGLNSIQ